MMRIVSPGSAEDHVDVSVCIAHYDGIDLVEACLASVRAQRCDLAVEILVHDDASTDGSAAHIRARHADVCLITSEENVGFCTANNRMAARARGRYLLLLNNDATLLPDALATLHGEAMRLGRPAILTLPQYDAFSGELIDIGSRLDPFLNTVPNRDPGAAVAMVAGACLWIDRVLWEELGGFPEWFGSVAEDLYLCCRARLAGHPVQALGHSGYHHRVGASLGGGKPQDGRLVTTYRRRALSERNRACVMAVTCPAPAVLILLPLHLLLLLAEGAVLSLLKLSLRPLAGIYLPVFATLLRQRRRILALRRSIMTDRRAAATDFFAVFDPMPWKLRMLLRHGLPRLDG
jgi:GT2 family glycosyltransferase